MKTARALGVFVVVQLILVGAYVLVDRSRVTPTPFSVETLSGPVPTLSVDRAGTVVAVPKDTYLVHFWATWCPPCRDELPGLLRAADDLGVPLLAVTDEPWPLVQHYFDQDVPSAVVRDTTGAGATDWRVSGLPDTFVVRDGEVVGRMGGPRDWNTPEARAFLHDLERTR